jgi:thioredoxin-related protein
MIARRYDTQERLPMHLLRFALAVGLLSVILLPARFVRAEGPAKVKETKWINVYDAAIVMAHKQDKTILVYFSGSDWDPYCQKLEKDVLNTPVFQEWAAKNAILLQIDYPKDKKISATLKAQNERLKQKFAIIKVPTFVFLDSSGLPYARAGFDEAKLRDEEVKGEPAAWIKYLTDTIVNKPKDEELIRQPGLAEGIAFGKKHFLSLLLMVTDGHAERVMQTRDDLVKNQAFVRWVNRNMAFAEVEWPFDTDTSEKANAFRAFAAENKLSRSPLQLVVWDMQTRKAKVHLSSINTDHIDTLISQIEAQLPRLDYNLGWIEDYRRAQAIAQQQKRYIFLCFTSMDGGEWSKKMFDEIFDTESFKDYARNHLVLVKLDFPTATTQPENVKSQNRTLAEQFNIRGFPTVVVLNAQGKKMGESKYMKGGPDAFLKQLDAPLRDDAEHRALIMGEDPPEWKKPIKSEAASGS